LKTEAGKYPVLCKRGLSRTAWYYPAKLKLCILSYHVKSSWNVWVLFSQIWH